MNYDEFAFFNQQLASMLRDGIPLEGALKQLCAGMREGKLRAEMEQLEAALAGGAPLKEALSRRALPEFYARMVEIGARSNDLPGVLTLLADHYHRANALWTRLKGLMVYPLIVVFVALGLTLLVSLTFSHFTLEFYDQATIPCSAKAHRPNGSVSVTPSLRSFCGLSKKAARTSPPGSRRPPRFIRLAPPIASKWLYTAPCPSRYCSLAKWSSGKPPPCCTA